MVDLKTPDAQTLAALQEWFSAEARYQHFHPDVVMRMERTLAAASKAARATAGIANAVQIRPNGTAKHGIYIASKTKHADRWRFLRDQLAEPIISTWIDEAGVGESSDLSDLWQRCIAEVSSAKVVILYREPDEELKGAWIELGVALTAGATVFAIGIKEFTVAHHHAIRHVPDMKTAIAAARAELRRAASAQTGQTFEAGQSVEKANGYKWPGIIIGTVTTLAGETRHVVECTVPEVAGALHIFSPSQLTSPVGPEAASDG